MSGLQMVLVLFLFLVTPVVAGIAWWLKRRYSAAIVGLQSELSPAGMAEGDRMTMPILPTGAGSQVLPQLPMRMLPAAAVPQVSEDRPEISSHQRLRRRVLSMQFLSGLLYWSAVWLLAAAVFVDAVGGPAAFLDVLISVGPVPLLALLVPPSLALVLQAGVDRRQLNVLAVVIAAVGLALQLSNQGWESASGFAIGYSLNAVLVSAFLRPSIRGAGLPLMSAALVGWLTFSGIVALALGPEGLSDNGDVSPAELAAGSAVLIVMLMASAWCAWRTLALLASKYQAKRFSDLQLALAMYWALMTMLMLGSVVREQTYLSLTGTWWTAERTCGLVAISWLLWRWAQSSALRRVVRAAPSSIGALLFLRVFKPSRRSEAFTDCFFAYWRFAAPIWMIAGPDLAGAYMEPDEYFDYIKDRLRNRFVAANSEILTKIQGFDNIRDPDGRFRINELLCSNETWRPTVLQMMAEAGVILLDLREFSRQRSGTRFELAELLRRMPLDKVLLLVDAKTDVTCLRAEVETIWSEVGMDRSDLATLGNLHILLFGKGSNSEMRGLFRAACQAAITEGRRKAARIR